MKFPLLVLVWMGQALAARAQTAPPPAINELLNAPKSGAQIFAEAKKSVFKLSTRLKSANSERGHGTAFSIRRDGFMITNFHVVAEAIEEPEKYELIVDLPSGGKQALVVGLDAVNDLALVKVNDVLPAALDIAPQIPETGDTIYSLGFPKSEELTVISGTFNGLRNMGFAPVEAASMPLNPGMSGGPSLNGHGEVIGVNRAMLTTAQNISYLSPLVPLSELVKTADISRTQESWATDLRLQIEHQEAIIVNSLSPAVEHREKLGAYSFALPFGGIQCGQDEAPVIKGLPTSQTLVCQTLSLALIHSSGNALQVKTIALQGPGTWSPIDPFLTLQQQYWSAKQDAVFDRKATSRSIASISEKILGGGTAEKCAAHNVTNRSGLTVLVRYCRLPISHLPGLYNTFVKVDLPNVKGEKTRLAQSYEGLSLPTTSKLIALFIESIHKEGAP